MTHNESSTRTTINGKEYIMFVKFGSKNNLLSLQQGKIYMKNALYYRTLEEKYQEKGQGDANEGTTVMYDVPICINGKRLPNASIMRGSNNFDETTPLFCCSCFKREDFTYNEESGKYYLKDNLLNWDSIQKDFGDYALIIPYPAYFISQINDYCNAHDYDLRFKEIEYVKFSSDNAHLKLYTNDLSHFFIKNSTFSYQKEFRLLLANCFTEKGADHIEFQLKQDFKEWTCLLPTEDLKTTSFMFP